MTSARILQTKDLWQLRDQLIAFENECHMELDIEQALRVEGVDLCELPKFGGEPPAGTQCVWSWDEDHLLVGEGPFDQWRIIERNEWHGK